VEGKLAGWIRWMAECGAPLVAVDVPSGLHSDTGATLGSAAQAAVTVTFARAKLGLTTPAGRERAGRILVASLGIPEPALVRFLSPPRSFPERR
jgi:NAD(P)H-hydrate epimerase